MNQINKSYLIWGAFILGIIVLLVGLAQLGTNGTSTTNSDPTTGSRTLTQPLNSGDHTKGNAEAEVTLVEYSDFQCPACKAAYPAIKALSEQYGDRVAIGYRHFPLRAIHPNAQLAAQAAVAASNQGKFWEMHDELFNTQSSWANVKNPTNLFENMAEKIGLDSEQFKKDLTAKATEEKVNVDYASGSASGVGGTPTFFLNGKLITNLQSYDQLQLLIDAELTKSGTQTGTSTAPTGPEPKVKSAN